MFVDDIKNVLKDTTEVAKSFFGSYKLRKVYEIVYKLPHDLYWSGDVMSYNFPKNLDARV